ncbi:MAG: hypothetical protein AAFN77_16845 [Planctomycetota bacterium]
MLFILLVASSDYASAQEAASNRQGIRNRIVKLREIAELKPAGETLYINFSRRVVRNGGGWKLKTDRELYQLFWPETIKGFRFDKALEDRVLEQASKLQRMSSKVFLDFVKNDDAESFDGFQAGVKDFDAWLLSQLDDDQQRRLASALSRRQLRRLGLKDYLESNKVRLGLTSGEISSILSELKPVAKKHVREGNQLCCQQLGGLPWDYIDNELIQVDNLPPLPIGFLVKRIELKDGSQERNLSLIEEYDVDFDSSVWLFEGPTYQIRGDGMIEFARFVSPFPRQRTPLSLLYDMTGIDFSNRQAATIRQCLIDTNERIGFEPSGDPKKLRSEILKFERSKWDTATQQLLPEQVEPIRNFVRLHACFTIGPELIATELLSNRKVDPKFADQLDEARERLNDFSNQAAKDMATKLVGLISQYGAEDLDVSVNDFHLDNAGFYETLIISILEP